ncbi:MAG: UDP-N-acetylmuramate dehydrogenase [Aquificaceae bacterium]|nr:UDP-N-acetylmuramate dehydrogenase [Aquificaceae bacterium]MCX8163770.1 UDP-N-acetylmuramate dehydrogenase [Aquificaceae bacterium]
MKLLKHVKLSSFTTIGVGGTARYFCEPKNIEDIIHVLLFALDKGLEVFPLGRGANTIFGDFDGIVLNLRRLRGIRIQKADETFLIEAMAGEPLSELVKLSIEENLEGLYRLAGFPATVGGAVAMNAGAFGYEIRKNLLEVKFLDWEGRPHRVKVKELDFSYRSSPFPELGFVVSALFEVPKAEVSVKEQHRAIVKKRKQTQPINMPTSGSTFKNPPEDYAGRLLEKVGMKGYRLGQVAFSDIHANFLVNLGGGTYTQVVRIIEEAKRRVFEEFGIILEEEVRLVEGSGAYGRKVHRT